MRLHRVILRRLEMPLRFRFRTSFGEISAKKFLLVETEADGLSGWGECVADDEPHYSEETNASAADVLRRFLVPSVLGRTLAGPESFLDGVREIRGNRMAKAALETALWDLFCRAAGVAIGRRLGGTRERVPVGVSLGIQPSIEELLELVSRHVDAGYARIKIKIEPGNDRAPVAAIRERFPSIELTVDANAAYTSSDTARLRELDRFALDYIEQPLGHEDLWRHAELARALRTPICLDESIRSAEDAAVAAAIGAARVVNVKIGRVGGLGEAVRIHGVCAEAGIPVWCGGMLESGVGRAANIQLATLPNFTKPGDTSSASRYFDEDIVDPPLEAERGMMPVPAGPGIGVEIRRDLVDRFTTWREEIAG